MENLDLLLIMLIRRGFIFSFTMYRGKLRWKLGVARYEQMGDCVPAFAVRDLVKAAEVVQNGFSAYWEVELKVLRRARSALPQNSLSGMQGS